MMCLVDLTTSINDMLRLFVFQMVSLTRVPSPSHCWRSTRWHISVQLILNTWNTSFKLVSHTAPCTCMHTIHAHERRLRSTESRTCVVARTYSSFGDRAFAAAGPVLWNSLPSHLKEADLL